jgi:hypothetical protein
MRKEAAREAASFCEPGFVSLSLQARFCGLVGERIFIAGLLSRAFYRGPFIANLK